MRMQQMRMVHLEEVIFTCHDGSEIHFRIELFQDRKMTEKFVVRHWRFEMFSVEPSFSSEGDGLNRADHRWAIIDPFLDGEEILAKSADEAIAVITDRLQKQLFR